MTGQLRIERPAIEVLASIRKAMNAGKAVVHSPDYVTADYSGPCVDPSTVVHEGVGHYSLGADAVPERVPRRILSMKVRCRKCAECLKERRMSWTRRAVREWRQSPRTWFVSLTMRPEEHFKLRLEVDRELELSGRCFDALPEREALAELLKVYGHRMDKFLMRVRKGLRTRGWRSSKVRYLWVPEPHKSGAIHFHMLLHEVAECAPIVKERIETAWGHGFAHARLVKSEEAARYVTKYLGKHHFEGRIRASKKYGQVEDDAETLLAALRFPGVEGGVPPRPYQPSAEAFAEMVAELGIIPGEATEEDGQAIEVEAGDELSPCASGLHIGVSCDCAPVVAGPAQDPFGTERGDAFTAYGVPRRKWALRGWREPGQFPPGRPPKVRAGSG